MATNKKMTLVERYVYFTGTIACKYSFGEIHVGDNYVELYVPDSTNTKYFESLDSSKFRPIQLRQLASGIEEAAKDVMRDVIRDYRRQADKLEKLVYPEKYPEK